MFFKTELFLIVNGPCGTHTIRVAGDWAADFSAVYQGTMTTKVINLP